MAIAQKSMTEGKIWKLIILFAFPIFLGNLFQQLYNAADSLIVGNFLGADALAAVSSAGNLIMMLIGFFNGIAMGAGVVIARCFGAKDHKKLKYAIHTNVAFGLIMGIALTIIGTISAPQILVWMKTPASVMPESITYFRVYYLGSIGLVMYNIFVGILQSLGDSKHPLYYLMISSVVNIVLDYILIAWLGMGVEAAAFATVLSQFISAALCMRLLMKMDAEYKLCLKDVKIHKGLLSEILKNGIPSGIQNSIIGIANVVVQTNINAFGAAAMAGCGAFSKIEGFAFLPITSFNMALTTFVGQNLGAKKEERARKGSHFGIWCSILLAEGIGIITFVFAPALISFFSSEPEVMAFGIERAKTSGLFFFLLAYTHAMSAVFRGSGRPIVPMMVMVVCWCVIRVTFLTVAGYLFHDIRFVYWVYPITWTLSSVVLWIYSKRTNWFLNARNG